MYFIVRIIIATSGGVKKAALVVHSFLCCLIKLYEYCTAYRLHGDQAGDSAAFAPSVLTPALGDRIATYVPCTVAAPGAAQLDSCSAHLFSSRTASSSSGLKSLVMLNKIRICSGLLPLIMLATLAHVRSSSDLISM